MPIAAALAGPVYRVATAAIAKGIAKPAAMAPTARLATKIGPETTTRLTTEASASNSSAAVRMRRVRNVSAATPPASSIPAPNTPMSVVKAARPGWARIADCTSMTNGDVTCGFIPAAANARADAPSARRDARLPTTSSMKSGSFTPATRASLS